MPSGAVCLLLSSGTLLNVQLLGVAEKLNVQQRPRFRKERPRSPRSGSLPQLDSPDLPGNRLGERLGRFADVAELSPKARLYSNSIRSITGRSSTKAVHLDPDQPLVEKPAPVGQLLVVH